MARYGRDFGPGMNRGWDRGFAGGYGARGHHRGWSDRDRVTFAPHGGYRGGGRDMGDQLREGWHDLKRGVRRALGGGGYDQGYRGGRGGYGYGAHRGGYGGRGSRYDRGWF